MTMFRRITASLFLLIVLICALAVAVLPWLRPDRYGVPATLALLVALVVGRGLLWRRQHRTYVVVVLAAALMVPAVVIARGFGRIDMMSVLFHADFGMAGATLKGLENEIIAGIVSIGYICLAVAMLAALWRCGPKVHLVAALGLVLVNPFVQFAGLWAMQAPVSSDLSSRLVAPDLVANPGPSPDIVVIYLEGLDRRFADPAVWGDLYAPLGALANEGISFTGLGQIVGTGWSLAGMVATQCGVPVVPRGLIYRNNYDDIEAFMPAIQCLGDVLAAKDYHTEFVVGGDLTFGGIDQFYATHGITLQTGLHEQALIYPPDEIEAASINWILDDQMVFQTARMRHALQLAGSQPFALIVETIGPHGKIGYLSRRCSDSGRGEKSRDMPRVVACTIEDTVAFVRHVQAEQAAKRPGRALRIVVLSDHLSHDGTTPPVAAEFTARNTAMFIGGPEDAGRVIDRAGSMIDIFPTMLEWLGFAAAPVGAGLGRSLLSAPQTLVEKEGIAMLDAMITGDAALSLAVWGVANTE